MTPKGSSLPRSAPCPCGSGKKYKRCCGAKKAASGRRQKPWLWIGLLALFGCLTAGIVIGQKGRSQRFSGGFEPTFYGGRNFGVTNYTTIARVDFSMLNDDQRAEVMRTANRQRCTCGCNMTLAQCINTDMTCPLRDVNYGRARQLVVQAKGEDG